MKLATQLSLVVLFITLFCGVITSVMVSIYTLRVLEQRMMLDIDVVIESIAPRLAESIINEDSVTSREILLALVSESRGLDFAYILDKNGDVLSHTFERDLPEALKGKFICKSLGDTSHEFFDFDYDGTSYLIGKYPLFEGVDFASICVGINTGIFKSEIRRICAIIACTSLGISIFGIIISVILALRMTRPLTLLTRSISEFGSGKTSYPVIHTGGTEISELSQAFHDMAEARNRAEETLRFQRALLEAQNETIVDGILIVAPDRKVLYKNNRFLELWSLSNRAGDIASDELLQKYVVEQIDESEKVLEKVEFLYSHPDEKSWDEILLKDSRFFERYSAPVKDSEDKYLGRIWIFRDVTDRRREEHERIKLEQQILHTQKLDSLGILAGGIAHDFNNFLTAIIGNADMAIMNLNPESPVLDNLKRIEKTAAHAADLSKQMLAYSGKGKFLIETIDLNRLIEEMEHMLEVSTSKKAILRYNFTRPMPSIEADATQIRQIMMNLVINASEAIGDKSGVISISTGCVECDRKYLKDVWLDENLKPGLYVYLEVADTGCGMDEDTISKIFDPFFTTKFTGRGLGMAAVLGIVRGHNGAIKIYSELNRGTTFKILLPASYKPAEIFSGDSENNEWHGSGAILLVDDDESVRAIGSEMLRRIGFDVITADNGHMALSEYQAHPEISCVILDLTMPHFDGEQTFRELRRINSKLKVIISSGYNEQEVTQKFAGKGIAGFIQKPYKLSGLRSILKQVFHESSFETSA